MPSWIADLVRILANNPDGGWIFAAAVLGALLAGFFWAVISGKLGAGSTLDRSLAIQEATVPIIARIDTNNKELLELLRVQGENIVNLRLDVARISGHRRS